MALVQVSVQELALVQGQALEELVLVQDQALASAPVLVVLE